MYNPPLATLDPSELAELKLTVQQVVDDAGYPARVRELEDSSANTDAALWTLLAQEIGLAGVGLPEEVGGLGGIAEILAVSEALGASLAPVPFIASTVLTGQILANAGDGAVSYLERIAGGEVGASAITNDKGSPDLGGIAITSDGATVTGTARFVAAGQVAAFFVVAAHSASGIDLYAVEAADAQVRALNPLDFSGPIATVSFNRSPAVLLVTDATDAIAAGVNVALLAIGADQLGGAQHCFDMTLEYIKVRRQFNREIGSFQAVKHRMADALMLVEMARSGLERATWETTENPSADASVVKAWGSDAYISIAAETVQLHGGIGFTWEHDAHLYFRRARYDAALLGDATFHRERIAANLQW